MTAPPRAFTADEDDHSNNDSVVSICLCFTFIITLPYMRCRKTFSFMSLFCFKGRKISEIKYQKLLGIWFPSNTNSVLLHIENIRLIFIYIYIYICILAKVWQQFDILRMLSTQSTIQAKFVCYFKHLIKTKSCLL
jgi:hypothetical protein